MCFLCPALAGTWSRLAQLKQVVTEPKGGGPEALKSVMAEYYDGVAVGRGGLFMAVCRGKVSEGLDFADGNARGVLIVGIPFPAIKDTKVVQKKAFNNAGASSGQGLLPGNTWCVCVLKTPPLPYNPYSLQPLLSLIVQFMRLGTCWLLHIQGQNFPPTPLPHIYNPPH